MRTCCNSSYSRNASNLGCYHILLLLPIPHTFYCPLLCHIYLHNSMSICYNSSYNKHPSKLEFYHILRLLPILHILFWNTLCHINLGTLYRIRTSSDSLSSSHCNEDYRFYNPLRPSKFCNHSQAFRRNIFHHFLPWLSFFRN